MAKFRFRFTHDIDIPANSVAEAEETLRELCSEQDTMQLTETSFSYLGQSEVDDINEEELELGKQLIEGLTRLTLLACQYRGENFTAVCTARDLGLTKVSFRPVALLLTNDKAEHLTDMEGRPPMEVDDDNS